MKPKTGWSALPQHKNIYDNSSRGCLDICWDADDDPDNLNERHVILTYAFPGKKEEHFHIRIEQDQAKALNKWLNKFLEEVKK